MDWIVFVITVVQFQLLAQEKWQGWVVALVNSGLWIILGYQQELYGLIALQLVLSCQFAFGLLRWTMKKGQANV